MELKSRLSIAQPKVDTTGRNQTDEYARIGKILFRPQMRITSVNLRFCETIIHVLQKDCRGSMNYNF